MDSTPSSDATLAVLTTIRSAFARYGGWLAGERLVVAVSGGLDSMVLLDALVRLRSELGVALHVAHLDHQLRPESARDSDFVAATAARCALPCTCAVRDVRQLASAQRRSLEDAAREARFAFLDAVAVDIASPCILLAHHADDQAETLLLRLLRGSGTSGLAGMRAVRDGRYFRPLLDVERAAIRQYAQAAGVAFREDDSNRDPRFLRNRVRHQLLPHMRRFNPRIDRALARTAELLGDDDLCLEQTATEACSRVLLPRLLPGLDVGKIALDAERLVEYHIAIQRRIIRMLVRGLTPRRTVLGYVQVRRILQLCRHGEAGYHTLGNGLVVQRSAQRLILGSTAVAPVDLALPVPGRIIVPSRGLRVRAHVCSRDGLPARDRSWGTRRAVMDAERLAMPLRVRSLRRGDVFQPHGMDGRKKLSDFLIDMKWPRLLRQGLLVLTSADDQIVWLLGLRTAEVCRVTDTSRRLIIVDLEPQTAGDMDAGVKA